MTGFKPLRRPLDAKQLWNFWDLRVFRPMRGAETTMLNRFAMLASVCVAIPVAAAPLAQADPPAPPDPAVPVNATNPLPPEGGVPSGPPGVLDTPDGWHLEVVGANETQLPVAPLTTALSSREYLVAGTFTGKITGGGKTKLTGGSMEAGEQIGCGIISDETRAPASTRALTFRSPTRPQVRASPS